MMYLLTEQAHAQIVDALENVYGKGKLCDAALAMLKSMEPVAQAVQPAHHIEQDLEMVQPAQVPEGWKLVPVEPTEAMCRAVIYDTSQDSEGDWQATIDNYRLMLAAAPSPKEGQL